MHKLDSVQLVALYKERLEKGEFHTPQLVSPSDMINYFLYVGNALAVANEEKNVNEATIIRYAINYENGIADQNELDDIITKHRQVFRSRLSLLRNKIAAQGKLITQFKAISHSAHRLPETNTVVFAWEFRLKSQLNTTLSVISNSMELN